MVEIGGSPPEAEDPSLTDHDIKMWPLRFGYLVPFAGMGRRFGFVL
jgi:hypothetical protein